MRKVLGLVLTSVLFAGGSAFAAASPQGCASSGGTAAGCSEATSTSSVTNTNNNTNHNTNTNSNSFKPTNTNTNKQGQIQGQGQAQGQSQSATSNSGGNSQANTQTSSYSGYTGSESYSGQEVNISTPHQAPAFGVLASGPCSGVTFAVSTVLGGGGVGFTDGECSKREAARTFLMLGLRDEAIEIAKSLSAYKATVPPPAKTVAVRKSPTILHRLKYPENPLALQVLNSDPAEESPSEEPTADDHVFGN